MDQNTEQLEITELKRKLDETLSELDSLKKARAIPERVKKGDATEHTYLALRSLAKTLTEIVSKVKGFRSVKRDSKKIIVDAVRKVENVIPVSKAVKIFDITMATFNTWEIDLKLQCENSYFEKCNKRYPHQVTPHEVQSVIKALTFPATEHWSIRNVHLYGLRQGTLTLSEGTIYKINTLLGIRKRVKSKKYKIKREGIRAIKPNQIWHMDITILKTLDGKRYYIYLVLDNFSRYILGYRISERVSGLEASELLQEAYNKAKSFGKELNIDLIVDGGVENNNKYVENFIRQSNINMKKLIALKDIAFSNSMIEYMNKILKYSYLFPKNIEDLNHLKRVMKYSVRDFCDKRPHGQLDGLTPLEAISGIALPPNFRELIYRNSRSERLKYSRANLCQKCTNLK